MKMLVTGGTGFIGQGLINKLLCRGHDVVVLDTSNKLQHNDVEVLIGDVRNFNDVLHATRGCDVVWHLAYINGTNKFYSHQDDVLDVAVRGALNTMDAALSCGVNRYVLASSGEVYNNPTIIPTSETERLMIPDVTNPRFSYSGGKIISELLAIHYAQKRGLDCLIFRPHNIYGPYMGSGCVMSQLMHKIYVATDCLQKQSCTICIQGTGDETRSYCYIDDLAEAAYIIGTYGKPGEIYNAGAEEEITIRQLIHQIGKILNIDIAIESGKILDGSPTRRCPDMSKTSALGFKPAFNMHDGLLKTLEWFAKEYTTCRL